MNLTLNAAALNSRQKGHLDSNFALAGGAVITYMGMIRIFASLSTWLTNLLLCCLSHHRLAILCFGLWFVLSVQLGLQKVHKLDF
ncbi:hypothetical protein ACET3Z_025338 [Daucus carota]